MEVKTPFFREESDSYTIGLNIIPIYFFSFFRVPKRVVDKLVSLQRRFLWGGASEQNKIAWIKWGTVCLKRKRGIENQGYKHFQSCTAWKMEVKSISASRTIVGQGIGV